MEKYFWQPIKTHNFDGCVAKILPLKEQPGVSVQCYSTVRRQSTRKLSYLAVKIHSDCCVDISIWAVQCFDHTCFHVCRLAFIRLKWPISVLPACNYCMNLATPKWRHRLFWLAVLRKWKMFVNVRVCSCFGANELLVVTSFCYTIEPFLDSCAFPRACIARASAEDPVRRITSIYWSWRFDAGIIYFYVSGDSFMSFKYYSPWKSAHTPL